MRKTTSEPVIVVPGDTGITEKSIAALTEFINSNQEYFKLGCSIKFVISTGSLTRYRAAKETILGEVVQAIADNPALAHWKHGVYEFDFGTEEFKINGEEAYFTPREKLLLFKILVQKTLKRNIPFYYQTIAQMRRRLNKDTLKGYL